MVTVTGYILKGGKLVKASPQRNKFNAEPVIYDGHQFDSKAEGDRYIYHKLRERAGEISDLKLQPEFELQEGFRDSSGKWQRPISYRADFSYTEKGARIVEDVKGHQTEVFKLKMKLFLRKYPEYSFKRVKITRKGQWVNIR